ncbi:putative phosphoesterase [Ralstonia phage RpT1]|nr:putative phosphoesterase [Ralstonia phage RpT1]
MKRFLVKYTLPGQPFVTREETLAVDIDAAYEWAYEQNPSWEIEAVIQIG